MATDDLEQQLLRLQDQIRDLADRFERQRYRQEEAIARVRYEEDERVARSRLEEPHSRTPWEKIGWIFGSAALSVSLLLGVQHEARYWTPAQAVVQAVERPLQIVSAPQALPAPAASRVRIDQIKANASRLEDWAKESGERAPVGEVVGPLIEDLKSLVKFPCTDQVQDESINLVVDLQMIAAQRVASGQTVTSVERRLQRLLSMLKELCR